VTDDQRRYIHGYHQRESERLQAQASSVLDLLHGDTRYPAGARVLEVGCGTGAQTVSLARNSPGARFVSFDHSRASLAQAITRVESAGVTSVEFLHADLFALPFERESFDHAFVCFVLEHLRNPVAALEVVSRLLKPQATITLFEGDHGSAYFHPHSDIAHRAIDCQVELQRRAGGNACIGRQLHPLLVEAGYTDARVSPRMVYVDATRPELVDSFTRKTFTWMVEGVRQSALQAGIIDPATFDAGIRDLYRAAEPDGVFCYTFFKGVAAKPPSAGATQLTAAPAQSPPQHR
jgi:SAM-dependent methyltransferase